METLFGDWVDDGDGLLLGEGELWGVLVGWEAGVLAGEVVDLGLHCVPRLPRFFLAIPWWFGTCLAKWFPCTVRARVWEGAKEQRTIASVDSANMLKSFVVDISSKRRQRESVGIKSDCEPLGKRGGKEQVEERRGKEEPDWVLWLRSLR